MNEREITATTTCCKAPVDERGGGFYTCSACCGEVDVPTEANPAYDLMTPPPPCSNCDGEGVLFHTSGGDPVTCLDCNGTGASSGSTDPLENATGKTLASTWSDDASTTLVFEDGEAIRIPRDSGSGRTIADPPRCEKCRLAGQGICSCPSSSGSYEVPDNG